MFVYRGTGDGIGWMVLVGQGYTEKDIFHYLKSKYLNINISCVNVCLID